MSWTGCVPCLVALQKDKDLDTSWYELETRKPKPIGTKLRMCKVSPFSSIEVCMRDSHVIVVLFDTHLP